MWYWNIRDDWQRVVYSNVSYVPPMIQFQLSYDSVADVLFAYLGNYEVRTEVHDAAGVTCDLRIVLCVFTTGFQHRLETRQSNLEVLFVRSSC
jgi:hypothetical protein